LIRLTSNQYEYERIIGESRAICTTFLQARSLPDSELTGILKKGVDGQGSGEGNRGVEGGRDAGAGKPSGPADHDFGGFDEGYGRVAGLEAQITHSVCSDNCGDVLIAHREHHFGQQPVDDHLDDGASELVAAANTSGTGLGWWRREEALQGFERDSMVAAWSLESANAPGENPVLERRITDAAESTVGIPGAYWLETPPRVLYTLRGTLVRKPEISLMESCDCNHSTGLDTDVSLPVDFTRYLNGTRTSSRLRLRLQN